MASHLSINNNEPSVRPGPIFPGPIEIPVRAAKIDPQGGGHDDADQNERPDADNDHALAGKPNPDTHLTTIDIRQDEQKDHQNRRHPHTAPESRTANKPL